MAPLLDCHIMPASQQRIAAPRRRKGAARENALQPASSPRLQPSTVHCTAARQPTCHADASQQRVGSSRPSKAAIDDFHRSLSRRCRWQHGACRHLQNRGRTAVQLMRQGHVPCASLPACVHACVHTCFAARIPSPSPKHLPPSQPLPPCSIPPTSSALRTTASRAPPLPSPSKHSCYQPTSSASMNFWMRSRATLPLIRFMIWRGHACQGEQRKSSGRLCGLPAIRCIVGCRRVGQEEEWGGELAGFPCRTRPPATRARQLAAHCTPAALIPVAVLIWMVCPNSNNPLALGPTCCGHIIRLS